MKKAVVLVGPTAVGKTALGIRLAKKHNGVIISADSVQVFKSLDIISGKDIDTSNPQEDNGLVFFTHNNIRFYLLDIVSPFSQFSVSQFQKIGLKALNQAFSNDNIPFIVGGTGLYVKSLIDGISTVTIKPDLKLREELNNIDLPKLQKILLGLSKKDYEGMNESDIKNKRRLIRKIEIIKNTKLRTLDDKSKNNNFDFLQIGLELPREELKKRIDARVELRIKDAGVFEAKDLFKSYSKLVSQVKDANGYKQLFEYLMGKNTLEEAVEKWKISEYRHAKNQMTWFKKDARIKWFDADSKSLFKDINRQIDQFIRG